MKLIEKSKSVVVVRLSGRLDAISSRSFQQRLAQVALHPQGVCILDMAGVDFIDSEGVCALVQELKRFNDANCRLAVCNLAPSARLIFEITQLDQVFEVFATLNDLLQVYDVTHEGSETYLARLSA